MILTLPLLPALRRLFPDARLSMLLRHYTGEIVKGNPYLHEILWYDAGGRPVPFRRMLGEIRQRRFSAAILVHPTLRLALLCFLAGVPIRVGSGYRWYSLLLNRRVYEHRKDARRHELEYNLNLVRGLGAEPPAGMVPEIGLVIPDQAGERVRALLAVTGIEGDYVVIHPGSGGSARDWPARSFGALATYLRRSNNVHVLITGGEGEEVLAEQVVEASRGDAVSLAGMLTVQELAFLLKGARVYIGNSTGPIHIAAAAGTPVVGLYPQHRAMSAARWGPYTTRKRVLVPDRPIDCDDCVRAPHQECACMASITVEQVHAAALELLSVPRDAGGAA